MPTTVEITLADDGSLTVGLVDQPSADVDDSQPAKNVAEALKMAGHLLANPPADTDDSGTGDPGDASDATDPNASPSPASGAGAAGGVPPSAGAGGGAPNAGQSAADMWNQLAAQTPPH